MDERPLVSAVIITHARKDLVSGAIDSVQAQTYDHIELLVIDDCSEDGTKEMLEERSAREGFTYIYIPKEESRGGNHARNLGIRAARGAYVAFLDDDDEWFPQKTEKQVRFLQQHPECGVVACFNTMEFNFKDRAPEDRRRMMEGDVHQRIFTDLPFVTSVAMYRRDVLFKAGLFDEALRYWQETDLNIRVAQIAEFGCVHEELALHRILERDKNRLTNHVFGWKEAVAYIEDKYRAQITALPRDLLRKRRLMIAQDGVMRAQNAGDRKQERLYLFQVFRQDPTIKNLARAIMTNAGYEKARDRKNRMIERMRAAR